MLKLENVNKLYSNNRGLRNTTIDFQEGEITAFWEETAAVRLHC